MNLVDILQSSSDTRREFNHGYLPDMLESGEITCRSMPFMDNEIIKSFQGLGSFEIDRLLTAKGAFNGTGGKGNHGLAAYAIAFLLGIGKEVVCEFQWNGRRVDVVSKDMEWFIECGDTNGEPIPYHLMGECAHVAVLPYGGTHDDIMWVFERGGNWNADAIIQRDKEASIARRKRLMGLD